MNENSNSGFVLSDSVARSTFEEDIYAHLGALVSVEFSRPDSAAQDGSFELSAAKYEALEQAAFEEAPRMEAIEPDTVDWSQVDEKVSAFEVKLTESLSRVQRSDDSERFITFSSKCYENFLAYRGMYPNGSNPWNPTTHLLHYGRIFVIGDTERKDGRSDVTALVRGVEPKPTAMPVDDRFTLQARLLAFLKTDARGHANKVTLKQMARHLQESMGISMNEAAIQVKLTVPLKRAGVIGSSSKGFFFIESEEDLIQSYCFHLTKVKSADKIMSRLQVRARNMNADLELETECSSSGKVLNRLLS